MTVSVAIGLAVSYTKKKNKLNKELSLVIQQESTGPGGSAPFTAAPFVDDGNFTNVANDNTISSTSSTRPGGFSDHRQRHYQF